MHELMRKRVIYSQFPTMVEDSPGAGGLVDLNATGDKFGFAPIQPIDIYKFGWIAYQAVDPDAGGLVVALDRRPTVGSDTDRVEIDVLTRANAQTIVAGQVTYREVVLADTNGETAEDGMLRNVGPSGPCRINPGEEAVLEVTNAAGVAATGVMFIEYAELAFNDEDHTDVVEDVT